MLIIDYSFTARSEEQPESTSVWVEDHLASLKLIANVATAAAEFEKSPAAYHLVFAPLSHEQCQRVTKLFRTKKSNGAVLHKLSGSTLSENDIMVLKPRKWLNDSTA